jgi:hypothetical protein
MRKCRVFHLINGSPPLVILIVCTLRRYYPNASRLRDQEHLADHVRSGNEGTFPALRVASQWRLSLVSSTSLDMRGMVQDIEFP